MLGLFGGLFDFNHDGKLKGLERAADLALFAKMVDEIESKKKLEQFEFGKTSEFEGTSEFEETSEFEPAELEVMEANELRGANELKEAIRDAGLNLDDYDL